MSYDPVESAAKGATQGFMNWSEDFIRGLASKFRNKELAFIQDESTIKRVKEQYRSGEMALYKEYVDDKEILLLLQMGLTLRSLARSNEEERRRSLRTKIFNKYNVNGLHTAQFVENGILNRYVGILIDDISSIDKFKEDLMEVLKNIEKHVLFVQYKNDERYIIKQALTIVASHSPMVFILSGISSAAEIVRNCETKLIELLKNYELEKISSKQKENLFFKRILGRSL